VAFIIRPAIVLFNARRLYGAGSKPDRGKKYILSIICYQKHFWHWLLGAGNHGWQNG
jgi:hypothetical protein